jgi:hypothetical protein
MFAPLMNNRASLNSRLNSEGSVIRGNKVYNGESLVSWCCFGYSNVPIKTLQNGYIAESHYKSGSSRRRKDRTFDVLCQVREVLEKQHSDSYPCKNIPHISKEFKMLSQFFGLEP